GIFNAGTLTLDSTIVGPNTALPGGQGPDIWGWLQPTSRYNLISNTSGIYVPPPGLDGTNLLNVDPQLNPIAGTAGPTQPMSLQARSPAHNTGDPLATDPGGNLLVTDQRGAPRPHGPGATPDIGAYDSHGVAPATHLVFAAPASARTGQAFTFTVTAQ